MQDNFKKTDKQNRIQWGKPSQYPQYSHVVLPPPSSQNKNLYQKSGDVKQTHKNGIDFQNLSIQESQIVNSGLRETVFSRHDPKDKISHSQYNKETVQRLNQIKNQFEILKGMMIDSRIVQKGHKGERRENQSNLSFSSSGVISHPKQSHLKIGEAVRTKDRNKNRKSHQISSSSASNKDLKSRKSQTNQFHEPHSRASQFLDNQKSRHSKMSKSKNSKQHHSHSIKGEKSRSGQRGSNRYDVPKGGGGFMSTNVLEKQSLELQLRSCLQKIQVLIENEIVLKTKNHQLQQIIRKYKLQSDNKSYEKQSNKINDLQNTIQIMEANLTREKQVHKQLLHKIGKLEADAIAHEAIVSMLKQEKNKQASSTMSMKLQVANLQIDMKRIQMEKDIDLRERDYEIARLRKENEMMRLQGHGGHGHGESVGGTFTSYEKQRIHFLQTELQERERKYRQVVSEMENKKYLKQQAELLSLVDKIHKNKANENESITKQLERLKGQISKIKTNQDLTQSQFGFESKVLSLQNALRKDGEQKWKTMNEIQKFQREHEELKRKYKELKIESESEIEELSRKNLKLKSALDQEQSYRQRYTHLFKQNRQITDKVQDLESIISNYEQIQNEVRQLRNVLRQKENAYNAEIKEAQRKVDMAQFEIFKSQKSNQFNLDISSRKVASEMDILRGQVKAIENERNYYYDQLNSLKNQYEEFRFKIKDIELSNHHNSLYDTQLEFQSRERIRKQYEEQMNLLNQRFLKQQQKLVERITILTNTNQQLTEVQRMNFILQSQNEQLRQLCRNKISTSENIIHLWEIKEVQYGNVQSILKEITPVTATISKTPTVSRVQSNSNIEKHKINLHSPITQSLSRSSLQQRRPSRNEQPKILQRYNSNDSNSQMMI